MTQGPIGEAHILISPDFRGFGARLKTELSAAVRAVNIPAVKIQFDIHKGSLTKAIAEANKILKASGVKAKIEFDLNRGSLNRTIAQAKAAARGAGLKAKVDVDDGGSIRRTTRGLDLLGGRGRSALRSLNREVFNSNIRLREMANILGGATLPVLVSLASVGVAAFGSLTAAAAAAAAAIAVLPGLIAAAVQGASVIGLAFSGIGDAVKAMGAAQTQAGRGAVSSARQQTSAANSIRDAQQALGRASREAALANEDATRRVRDATRNLADSQREARQAQLDLNQSRRDARDGLVDLRLEESRLALDIREAALSRAEAEAELQRVTVSPTATALERQRAQLRAEQARLAERDIRRRIELNRREIRQGVEGSDQVRGARERLAGTNERVADAARGVADAEREAARQRVQSAEQVIDAQRRLADAQTQAASAATGAAGGVDKLGEAMSKLSPPAQRFARFLFSLKPRLDALKAAAASGFLPGLEDGIHRLVTGLFPTFRTITDQTARAMGELARQGGTLLASGPFRRDFAQLGRDNVQIIHQAGQGSLNLVDALRNLVAAARPLTLGVSRMVLGWTEYVRGAAASGRESGRLSRFFEQVRETLYSLARVAGNVGATIAAVLSAAFPSGVGLLGSLEEATGRMRELATSSEGLRNMREFFERARPAIETIGGLIVTLARKLFEIVVHIKNATERVSEFLDEHPRLAEMVASAAALAFAFKGLNVAGLAGVIGSLGQLVAFNPPLALAGAAIIGLGAAFLYAYNNSPQFKRAIDDLGRTIKDTVLPALKGFAGFIKDDVIPALKRAWPFVEEKLVGGLILLRDALRDNEPGLRVFGQILLQLAKWIGVTLIPFLFRLWSVHLKTMFGMLAAGITVLGLIGRAFKVFLQVVLLTFGGILDGAAAAFGWMPGIGGKLKTAREKFKEFAKGVNAALDGIKDRDVKINARGQFKIPGMSVHDIVGALGPGKAVGGPIAGPGPKGRDSVLMYGAPGEHMLTASEVDRAGGHGAVYALRAAIRQGWRVPGFATGGAVGDAGDARGVRVTASGSISPLEQGAAAFDRILGRIAQSIGKALQGIAGVGGRAGQVFAFLRQQLGESYLWGATGPDRWDCSGLMLRAFEKAGVHLPRVARQQQHAGRAVSRAQARMGDLIYFGNPAHHIGFYMGGDTMLHAPHTGDVVKVSRNRVGTGYRRVLDKGGFLMPGINVVENRTGRPELVPGPGRDRVGRAVSAGFGQGLNVENLIVQPITGRFRIADVMTELRLQGVH